MGIGGSNGKEIGEEVGELEESKELLLERENEENFNKPTI